MLKVPPVRPKGGFAPFVFRLDILAALLMASRAGVRGAGLISYRRHLGGVLIRYEMGTQPGE